MSLTIARFAGRIVPPDIDPGFYEMPYEVYRAAPGENISYLKTLLEKSPHHAHYERTHPSRDFKQSLTRGQMFHTLLLEPELFDERFFVTPDGFAKRSKDQKAQWAAWVEKYGEANIIHDKEAKTAYRKAREVVGSIRANKMALEALSDGHTEVSMFWRDPDTGLLCKGRMDYLQEVMGTLLIPDVKSTVDASPAAFQRTMANFGYHLQNAFYVDGAAQLSGLATSFAFITIESSPPFACPIYELSPEDVEIGREEYKRALQIEAACKKTGVYPSYPDLSRISLPGWKRHQQRKAA